MSTTHSLPRIVMRRLPKNPHQVHPDLWKTLIAKQKALRLHSLLTAPEAFSSTYERESAFTDADWEARLQNPSAYTFVAIRFAAPTPIEASNEDFSDVRPDTDFTDGDWVGIIVLVGPEEKLAYGQSDVRTFDLAGLFVLLGARGEGLGGRLIRKAGLGAAGWAARLGARKAVVRAAVARGNERVLSLYERTGFVEGESGRVGVGLGEDVKVLVKEIGC